MDLGNPFEVLVHQLLIGGIVGLDHRDEVPMVSVLLCMITYWTRPIVSYDFTKPLHCIISKL